jgi:hypothetical protein
LQPAIDVFEFNPKANNNQMTVLDFLRPTDNLSGHECEEVKYHCVNNGVELD